MTELNEYILQKAIEANICEEWAGKIASASGPAELMDMYCKGIDFCLSNNFPSNNDLVKLAEDELVKHGVYVDVFIDAENKEFVVLLGASTANLDIYGHNVSQIYIKHSSKAEIRVVDIAFVVIDCFDEANVNLIASGNCKVLVNIYGNARVTTTMSETAMVKTIHKNKTTY
jgi:hypothetical protein